MDCLERFRPMLTKVAWQTGVSLDDLKQQAVVIILEALPKMSMHMDNPQGYLYVTVRGKIYNYIHTLTSPTNVISLDQPLCDDSQLTLLDVLPVPPIDLSAKRNEKRRVALYKAMHLLPRAEQECLRRRYGLRGFHVWSRQVSDLYRTNRSIMRSALRSLRRNQKLAAAFKEV